MNDSPSSNGFADAARDLGAGGALGGFVGLLVGLSASEVVGVVLSALGALLGGLFSIGPDFTKLQSVGRHWRIVGFGGSAMLATLAGLWLRTHDALSPSFEGRLAQLTSAGVPLEVAHDVALYQHAGVLPSGMTGADGPSPGHSTVFAASTQACSKLGSDRHAGVAERSKAFVLQGGPWKELAELTEHVAPSERGDLLQAAWRLACEDR